jgi:hypothetical protein
MIPFIVTREYLAMAVPRLLPESAKSPTTHFAGSDPDIFDNLAQSSAGR